MVIEIKQSVVFLSGRLVQNCWSSLRTRISTLLRSRGEVTIYCDEISEWTRDGLMTLAMAQGFALENEYQIDVDGLSAEMQGVVTELVNACHTQPADPLPALAHQQPSYES